MADKIQIMVVDDNLVTRDNIRKLLELESDLEVMCEAATGEEAVRKAKIMLPDIILMDINMPGMDGIAATELISAELPQCLIIVVSVQGEQEYLRKAMSAGAKDYLVKPFESDELLECIRHIYSREQKKREKVVQVAPVLSAPKLGKVVTIFSTKGGIGKTTIATNLGAALGFDANTRVCIIDLDLQFGDVALFLNIIPKATIADLVRDVDNLDGAILDGYMTKYKDNIKVLAAPARPEQADGITAAHLATIVKELQYNYDYVVVDTAPLFNDVMFSILDMSTLILVATSQDLPTLKNVKLCLEILESLNYSNDKIRVVLNRANSLGGLSIKDSEDLLQRKFLSLMPSDGKTVVTAVNQGVPFVTVNPNTTIAQAMIKLADYVVNGDEPKVAAPVQKTKGGLSGFFSGGTKDKEKEKDFLDPSAWSLS